MPVARRCSTTPHTGILVFFLLVLDFFIPSWVLGPWFLVFNAFIILGIAVGIRDSFR